MLLVCAARLELHQRNQWQICDAKPVSRRLDPSDHRPDACGDGAPCMRAGSSEASWTDVWDDHRRPVCDGKEGQLRAHLCPGCDRKGRHIRVRRRPGNIVVGITAITTVRFAAAAVAPLFASMRCRLAAQSVVAGCHWLSLLRLPALVAAAAVATAPHALRASVREREKALCDGAAAGAAI
eukprot:366573-Chlamydomonas_euryale.AAC.31